MLVVDLKLLILSYFNPICLSLPSYYQLKTNDKVKSLIKNKNWLVIICKEIPMYVDNSLSKDYINWLTNFYQLCKYQQKCYNLALQYNTKQIRFGHIGSGCDNFVFNFIHNKAILLTNNINIAHKIHYGGIDLELTTIETTDNIVVNAAQYLVNQLWWSNNKNKNTLERLAKLYNYQQILWAAYSLATIDKDSKNYKNYYNQVKSEIAIYTIVNYFGLSTLISQEAEVLYWIIKTMQKINITTLQEYFHDNYRQTLTNSFNTILQYLCQNYKFGVKIINNDVIYKI